MRDIRFAELVKNISKRTKVKQADTRKVLSALYDELMYQFEQGECKIRLKKIGYFYNKYLPIREGEHPFTKEKVIYKERFKPRFFYNTQFRKELNKRAFGYYIT